MGIADIIPGVSGGTMALILGIYEKLINALKNLNLNWLLPLFAIIFGKNNEDNRTRIAESLRRMDLPFLFVLGTGIISALVAGGAVIPYFIDNHPQPLRAFFFGLILASVWVPLAIAYRENIKKTIAVGLFLFSVLLGFYLTSPNIALNTPENWVPVTSGGGELNREVRQQMSARPAAVVLNYEGNRHLQTYEISPNEINIPAGTEFYVPRPATWFVFISGAIAITAMILPGISGSYILLILGSYYFILNVLNAFRHALQSGMLPFVPAGYMFIFITGIIIGLLAFARVLNYFLTRWHGYTMSALAGLMLGCLRGVWPFRLPGTVPPVNYFPTVFNLDLVFVLIFFFVGLYVVAFLTTISTGQLEKSTGLSENV